MAKQKTRVTTADKIVTLIRIYHSAAKSGDTVLENSARSELSGYGIEVGSKLADDMKGVSHDPK